MARFGQYMGPACAGEGGREVAVTRIVHHEPKPMGWSRRRGSLVKE